MNFLRVSQAMIGFWRQHGADHAVLQTDLERHILQSANVRVDPRTARNVLYQLRKQGIIRMAELDGGNILCRLAPLAVDPLWPRFNVQVDERLADPFTFVDRNGRFFRVGRPGNHSPFVHRLWTAQPYFGPFTWARAWLHAYTQGFLHYAPAGLPIVTQAARQAVLGYVWACCTTPSWSEFASRVADAFQGTRASRKVRSNHHFGANCPNGDCSIGLAAPVALAALQNAACPAGSKAPRLGSLHGIYEDLDLLIVSNIRSHARDPKGSDAPLKGWRRLVPNLRSLEHRRRIDGPEIWQTLPQWERGWGAWQPAQ